MNKIATVNARIEPDLKIKVEHILQDIGLTPAEAIRIFYKQIFLNKGIPFEIRIPNKKSLKALEDIRKGKVYSSKNVDDFFENL